VLKIFYGFLYIYVKPSNYCLEIRVFGIQKQGQKVAKILEHEMFIKNFLISHTSRKYFMEKSRFVRI